MGETKNPLTQFAADVGLATLGQVTGRFVNFILPFVVLAKYGVSNETDKFFLWLTIAFYVYGTAGNALIDASVPLVRTLKLPPRREWVVLSIIGASLIVVFGTLLTAERSIGFMCASAGAAALGLIGVLASPHTAMLHARGFYLLPGILWLVRLLPLGLFALFVSDVALLPVLIPSLAIADYVRAYVLQQFACSRGSTLRDAAMTDHRNSTWVDHYAPLVAAALIAGLNPIVDRMIANLGQAGSVSLLEGAERMYAALATFATVGVATVLLTELAKHQERGTLSTIRPRILGSAFLWASLWAILGIMASWMFHKYDFVDVLGLHSQGPLLESTFVNYTAGLPAFVLSLTCARYMVILGLGRWLMRLSVVSVLANVALSYAAFLTLGLPGIALATTFVTSLISLAMMLLSSRSRINTCR